MHVLTLLWLHVRQGLLVTGIEQSTNLMGLEHPLSHDY